MKTQKGFSLLEVVIALGIMASVMMLLVSGWRGNYSRVKKVKFQTQAAYLLQKKMSEIEVQYQNRVKEMPTEKKSGSFKEKKFKDYSWEWEAKEFKLPELQKLLFPEGDMDEVSVSVATNLQKFFEDSIKEVRLTLIYKGGPKQKPKKISIATIMADYNTKLNLGF